MNVGDRVKFRGEKQAYTDQVANDRFAICTKPFNPRHTVLYTIIDFERRVRGTENLIFCQGFETKQLCAAALTRLVCGESEVSHRNRVQLDIEWVK